MTRWLLTVEAGEDLDRLTDFLLESEPDAAIETVELNLDALGILVRHPRIGRILVEGLRELVISRGRSGYVALYSYDEAADVALVLALRHQREGEFH
jgi:plasmid stabilization system protein ParE